MDLKEIIEIIAAMIAISGLFFGLFQYSVSQKWKRLEFASRQLERMTIEPELELATKFIDWQEREIYLPQKYQELMVQIQKKSSKSIFQHSRESLSRSMNIEKYIKSPVTTIYLDVFDRLFDFLEQIYHLIEIKVIKAEDVKSLNYYIRRIENLEFDGKKIFDDYLKKFNYDEIPKLVELFNKKFNNTK